MPVKKLAPILFVEKIEPVLPFWTQCRTSASWHWLLMYQSYTSAEKDMPAILGDHILRRRLLPDLTRVAGLRGLQFEVTGKRSGVKMRFCRQPRGAACRPLY
jgi:hypothetical protein